MFKFLVLEHANTIFVIGILIEAMVFLVSAFEWKSGDSKEYAWERVFLQLAKKDEVGITGDTDFSKESLEVTQSQQIDKIMQSIIAINASVNQLNDATKRLTRSLELMEKNYETMSESTQKYQQQIDTLRSKIADANNKLNTFENYKIQ